MNGEIRELFERIEASLFSESMVKQLVDKDIGEYERGVVMGRIEMLNHIKIALERDSEDEVQE